MLDTIQRGPYYLTGEGWLLRYAPEEPGSGMVLIPNPEVPGFATVLMWRPGSYYEVDLWTLNAYVGGTAPDGTAYCHPCLRLQSGDIVLSDESDHTPAPCWAVGTVFYTLYDPEEHTRVRARMFARSALGGARGQALWQAILRHPPELRCKLIHIIESDLPENWGPAARVLAEGMERLGRALEEALAEFKALEEDWCAVRPCHPGPFLVEPSGSLSPIGVEALRDEVAHVIWLKGRDLEGT